MKKSYQVEGLIWSWDRIPNFRSTAPISTIFKALEGEGSGGEVEGYGGRVWWKGMVEGGRMGKGQQERFLFTDDDPGCQTQTLHYERLADRAWIEFEILPFKLTWRVARTYL